MAMVLLLGACTPNKALFVEVVSDHRMVTTETSDRLIKAIQAELDELGPKMLPADVQASKDLIERLEFMKQGSIVIEKYVMQQADQESLAKVVRNKVK